MPNKIQAEGDLDRSPLSAHAALAKQIKWLGTLGHVIPWGLAQKPPWLVVDVVIQDEYTHDVILARESAEQRGGEGRAEGRAQGRDEEGGDGAVLILDCTWLGGVNAVSVWDHQPTADELLADRVKRGWQPTPTATQQGPQILGHACKLPLPPSR